MEEYVHRSGIRSEITAMIFVSGYDAQIQCYNNKPGYLANIDDDQEI
jgi:hypothetical protein